MPAVGLKALQYWERIGHPKQWTLDGLTLGPINLIVGANATGKTRTLNTIWNLAKFFFPEPKFRSENAGYDIRFDCDEGELRYILEIVEGKVTREEVHLANIERLVRKSNGEGTIFTKEENKHIRFRPPENELAAVIRRDSLQHWFLEPLHEWALAVRHYLFGKHMGRDVLVVPTKDVPEPDERDPNQVFSIFRKGEKDFGSPFVEAIIRDMAELHYHIEKIEAHAPENIKILRDGIPSDVLVLAVKEQGLAGLIPQGDISQGMFRALSILIQINYSQLTGGANCILIDDIGEGLDFERSKALVRVLREKALASQIQLVMSTNDRFVMNSVPLKEWSVLLRRGNLVQVKNYNNSRRLFDEYELTGLSNFDFFATDFLLEEEEAGQP